MDLQQICEKAERENDLSQNELAKRIGLQPSALSHVMNKRRKLPAEAAIELSDLTGLRAKEVWSAALRWAASKSTTAALMAAVVVSCFLSMPGNAVASQRVTTAQIDTLPIIAVYATREPQETLKRLSAGAISKGHSTGNLFVLDARPRRRRATSERHCRPAGFSKYRTP